MSNQYVGEIRMFGCNFTPVNWLRCDGALLSIAQNEVLYTLLGTTYGGDGVTTFGTPNMLGRVPVGQGQGPGLTNRVIGELAGTETVTLTTGQLPAHTHSVTASTAKGIVTTPNAQSFPATPDGTNPSSTATFYTLPGPNTVVASTLSPQAVGTAGSSLPHENMMPTLCINFCIAAFGIFPSQN